MGRALGEHLDEREADAVDLELQRLLDGALRVRPAVVVVERDPLDVDRAVELRDQLGHLERLAGEQRAAVGGGRRVLPSRVVGAIWPPVIP